jgi:polyhydroxybutyrate depolymerase
MLALALTLGCGSSQDAAHEASAPNAARVPVGDAEAAPGSTPPDEGRSTAAPPQMPATPTPELPAAPVSELAPGSDPIVAQRSTGPGDWGPGDYPPALREQVYLEIGGVSGQEDLIRQYKVHVPPGYDPDTPTPLVFCFHGLAQNAVMFCVDGANMVARADAMGYLLVMPTGVGSSWNAGTCCGDASARGLDDVALTRAILEDVGAHLNVDLDRVYATGFSNGGYMSLRLACEAADMVAAVAPGSGAIGTNGPSGGTNPNSDFVTCEPSRAVSVLAIHGTEDFLVPYSTHEPALSLLANVDACSTSRSVPTTPASQGDTECVSYDDCATGIEVTGCTVNGGGHVWFGDPGCGTGAGAVGCAFVGANSTSLVNTAAMWDFFARVGAKN